MVARQRGNQQNSGIILRGAAAIALEMDQIAETFLHGSVLAHIDEFAVYLGLIQAPLGVFVVFTQRSEEHTSELQSLMRISYAVFCLKKKNVDITASA